jgi:hypothetical protein
MAASSPPVATAPVTSPPTAATGLRSPRALSAWLRLLWNVELPVSTGSPSASGRAPMLGRDALDLAGLPADEHAAEIGRAHV